MEEKIEFYKEIEFKDTEIGKIPKEWEVVKLEHLVKMDKFAIVDGPFGTQLHSNEYVKWGVPLIRVDNINENGSFNPNNLVYITEEKWEELERSAIFPGDILLAKTGATIGKVCLFPEKFKKGLIASSCAKITVDSTKAYNIYIFYFLLSNFGYSQILALATGSTRPTINLNPISKIKIAIPKNLKEQQRIAEVLSTIDEAIQKTDEIITKTESLKKGLMQELLTKGIGHREFKDTEIGRIPKEWEVVKLENVVEIEDKYRIPVKKQDRQLGPFPYCGANGIIDYVAGYTHDGKFVLLAEDGGFFGPFENSAYIMRGKFWANNHVHILKANEEVLISEFLAFCLNFINLVPFLTGSTRPKLTQEDMGMIPLPLPPLEEQQKIAEIISAVDEKLKTLKQEKAKLERIKQWFMEELLSGRIRVRAA